jgi:3-phosphoshikimate 1-carboxyvinyltransferase
VLDGTEPLRRRPMGRVAEPLRLMGAAVDGEDGGRLPPLTIRGGNLKAIDYSLPVASAQVKSAILLAALFAGGETAIHEPGPSRDHTERMLRWFGANVDSDGPDVRLCGGQSLKARADPLVIPGDFSSAAFPLVAAAIVRRSNVTLRNVGLNPTRTGLLDLLLQMGGLAAQAYDLGSSSDEGEEDDAVGEPAGELAVRATELHAVEVGGDLVVRAIDEFPIFTVMATQAEGETVVRDAAELRVKESDRIATVSAELRKMGAKIDERPDGMLVHGPVKLKGAEVECHRDHRLAMALAVAGLVADGPTTVHGAEAIGDSFPGFVEAMRQLGADIKWQG